MNQAERTEILQILGELLAFGKPAPPSNFEARYLLHFRLITPPPAEPPELRRIHELLTRLSKRLGMVNEVRRQAGRFPTVGRHTSPKAADINDLAVWLVMRAGVIGADQATTELASYVETEDEVECTPILMAGGIQLAERITLPGDIEVWPIRIALKDPAWAERFALMKPFQALTQVARSSVIFAKTVRIKHGWLDLEAAQKAQLLKPGDSPDFDYKFLFEQAVILSALLGPMPAYPILFWVCPAPNTPSDFVTLDWFRDPRMPFVPEMPPAVVRSWSELLVKMQALSDIDRERFSIPLRRLHRAAIQYMLEPVDACIDLRIALETALNDGGSKTEIAHRLAIHYARYCGSDMAERKQLFALAKKTYGGLSDVVHKGRSPSSRKERSNLMEHIGSAGGMTTFALLKILDNKKMPDWDDVELEMQERQPQNGSDNARAREGQAPK